MKNPLHYQLTEYDCGPTSMLNAINFLFEREDIPPDLIRNIMLYCLDRYDAEGSVGKKGTSRAAMMFLSNWLDSFGKTGKLSISSEHLAGESVAIHKNSRINEALRNGGVAVVRLYYDVSHYVLLTGERDGNILVFDPYYRTESLPQKDIIVTLDHPFSYNRIVPISYFNQETKDVYALGEIAHREAVLLFNEQPKTEKQKND